MIAFVVIDVPMQEVHASGADVVQVVGTPRGRRARPGVTRRPVI
jgi:hypothetical protein